MAPSSWPFLMMVTLIATFSAVVLLHLAGGARAQPLSDRVLFKIPSSVQVHRRTQLLQRHFLQQQQQQHHQKQSRSSSLRGNLCDLSDDSRDLCERCAKFTRNEKVFPLCCRGEGASASDPLSVLDWCREFMDYGLAKRDFQPDYHSDNDRLSLYDDQ